MPVLYGDEVFIAAPVVQMGALGYSGPHDYHIFDAAGTKRLRESAARGSLTLPDLGCSAQGEHSI